MLALRIMPILPTEWEVLSDRLRIVGDAGHPLLVTSQDGWHQMKLQFPDGDFCIQCLPLTERHAAARIRYDGRTSEHGGAAEPVMPKLRADGDEVTDWSLDLERSRLANKRLVLTLWGISVDGPVTAPPLARVVVPEPRIPRSDEESVWQIEWQWPTTSWRVRVDPQAAAPLVETRFTRSA